MSEIAQARGWPKPTRSQIGWARVAVTGYNKLGERPEDPLEWEWLQFAASQPMPPFGEGERTAPGS